MSERDALTWWPRLTVGLLVSTSGIVTDPTANGGPGTVVGAGTVDDVVTGRARVVEDGGPLPELRAREEPHAHRYDSTRHSRTALRMAAEPYPRPGPESRQLPYPVLMPVTRMNHAVLYVRDVARTVEFYRNLLGFRVKFEIPGQAAFLQAPASNNDHDLGVFQVGPGAGASEAGQRTVGLYHLAWEVDTLDELERIAGVLRDAGSLVGASDHGTTKALYAKDPDGLEFEVCWLVPADRLPVEIDAITKPLDLSAEKDRYGGSTRGGVGVSFPALA